MFKWLIFLVIAILLYQMINNGIIQLFKKEKEQREGVGKKQGRFDKAQIVDAEFREIDEDGEEKP